ncbi:MAG TPA: alcohol dehydrogenase catalytic domain-containing protein [Acidimicrobiales bacterium]|nr:alcohol dehydrogenase catalytic domain-containing protein [Acidimicrobiales bacterium]MDP7351253.1 alcohol dehydrogenase catalytic domain-containing protein [Acidimicrobiales bacterium]MDP7506814.1 alcohol dehydrogenase catalytic domain-containing protein [Acidimicrobiales bacterium]MEE1565552.1 alcohol dehydrogenase catalytic domain-containing protein [Acidimicrobiales bacterium]HJL76882.1 alcohol dehydrogenase catalytic domain-containing protein [Acidimicrobiales bacterium]
MPGGTTVRAAVCRGVGEPQSIEHLVLAAPGPGEVRVRIDACAVCHSDLMYTDGGWATDFPLVMGHEAAGCILETGPAVADVAVGDQVVVSLVRSCGECPACRRGHHVTCSGEFALDRHSPLTDGTGSPVAQGLNTGAFAEQVVVHRSQVVPHPADVPSTSASLLACGVLTGAGAVHNTAQVQAGDVVAVVGCGGVGIGAIQGARLAGAEQIVAVDPLPDKRESALLLGASHAVDPVSGDVAAVLREATGGRLADHLFITTAAPSALDNAVELLAPMGALVLVGMPPDGIAFEVDPTMLAAANQRILGSKMGTVRLADDIPRLIDHYRAGDFELDALVTTTHSLEDIDLAFEEVRRGEVLRTVILPNGHASPDHATPGNDREADA